ncbi:MAG: T9SS type A sorting domain-containing protein [Mangrovibacterium sp.]
MIKFLLLSLCLTGLLCSQAAAQDVLYHYDQAGNRTERVIALLRSYAEKSVAEAPQVYEEILAEKEIKIYPNPTRGQLSVSITGMGSTDSGTVLVSDMNGRPLLTKSIQEGLTPIDLSDRPDGYYLLKIVLGTETSTWKIIKQ